MRGLGATWTLALTNDKGGKTPSLHLDAIGHLRFESGISHLGLGDALCGGALEPAPAFFGIEFTRQPAISRTEATRWLQRAARSGSVWSRASASNPTSKMPHCGCVAPPKVFLNRSHARRLHRRLLQRGDTRRGYTLLRLVRYHLVTFSY